MMKHKTKILFLVSGGGGNLQFINNAIKKLNLPFQICAVVADRECNALLYASKNNIPSQQIKYSKNYSVELKNTIQFYQPEIIITTFHKIIDEETLQLFSPISFLNLHYSLLPNFKNVIGMKTIEMAKTFNHKSIGATVHVVEKEVDAGKIIIQGKLEIENWNNENLDLLTDTVFKTGCIILLNAIISITNSELVSKKMIYQLNQKEVTIETDYLYTIVNSNNLLDLFKIN